LVRSTAAIFTCCWLSQGWSSFMTLLMRSFLRSPIRITLFIIILILATKTLRHKENNQSGLLRVLVAKILLILCILKTLPRVNILLY